MCCSFLKLKCLAHKRFKTGGNSVSFWNNPLFEDPTNRTSNNLLCEGAANLSSIQDISVTDTESSPDPFNLSTQADNGYAMHETTFYVVDVYHRFKDGVGEAKEKYVTTSVVMHHETRRFRIPQVVGFPRLSCKALHSYAFLDFLSKRFTPVWYESFFDYGIQVESFIKDRLGTQFVIGTIDYVEFVFQTPFHVIVSPWYSSWLVIVPCKNECDLSVPWTGYYFLNLQKGKLCTQTSTYILDGCMNTFLETCCSQGWCLGHNKNCCFRLFVHRGTVESVFDKVVRLYPQNDPITNAIICVEMNVLKFKPKCTVVGMKVDYHSTFEALELCGIIDTESIDHCHVPFQTGCTSQARNDDDIILVSDCTTNNPRLQDKAIVKSQEANLTEEDIYSKITAASTLNKVTTQGYGVGPNKKRTKAQAVGKRKQEPFQEEPKDDEDKHEPTVGYYWITSDSFFQMELQS